MAAKKKIIKKVAKKAIKKVVKKTAKKPVKKVVKVIRKEKKVGKITHYFDKIKVVVVKLSDDLSVGETIRIIGGENTDFKQKIVSMEFNGEKIKKAKKGKQVGIRVKDRAREGYKVFKV
ncbi:translation elongation factor-like protein [bacterium]|jgi:putative protease|nr:translation elongation factor-like protein [bacterium]